jgi:hypothetical protein
LEIYSKYVIIINSNCLPPPPPYSSFKIVETFHNLWIGIFKLRFPSKRFLETILDFF